MSTTRDQLTQARRAYQRVQYPGDLADDVFARLDAGERHAADLRLDDVDAGTLQKIHPGEMRIGSTTAASRFGASPWRPVLAIAAAVAILASTVAILVHTGRDETKTPTVALNDPATPVVVEPPPVAARPETTVPADEASTDFTIVPSYQSFAFSVPTSLTPASIDEYDRQAREATATTTTDAATTDQGSRNVQ